MMYIQLFPPPFRIPSINTFFSLDVDLITPCPTFCCPQLIHLRNSLLELLVLTFLVAVSLGLFAIIGTCQHFVQNEKRAHAKLSALAISAFKLRLPLSGQHNAA
jgi:hypothetical protein